MLLLTRRLDARTGNRSEIWPGFVLPDSSLNELDGLHLPLGLSSVVTIGISLPNSKSGHGHEKSQKARKETKQEENIPIGKVWAQRPHLLFLLAMVTSSATSLTRIENRGALAGTCQSR